jgi:dihydrofolate synthase/folylpolyglutamate synthase
MAHAHGKRVERDARGAQLVMDAPQARELRPLLPRITDRTIEEGVASTRWRGRLQHLTARGKDVWIDGGHNPHAALAVAPFIRDQVDAPRTLVFGIMTDKDPAEVAATLFPLFDEVIATEPYPPRSASAASLVALAAALGVPASAEPDPSAAIERALAGASRSVVIAGSLYLAGAALAHFD